MFNLVSIYKPKKYIPFNLILSSNITQISNNNKIIILKNKESLPSYKYNFVLPDCVKYYNQNYSFKQKYDWRFEW